MFLTLFYSEIKTQFLSFGPVGIKFINHASPEIWKKITNMQAIIDASYASKAQISEYLSVGLLAIERSIIFMSSF